MSNAPFTRYIVFGPSLSWWENIAPRYLESKGWNVVRPKEFNYKESYGHNPTIKPAEGEVLELKYRLAKASAVVEYRGPAPQDSVFDPKRNKTLIDDLLAFMSIYTGIYWQHLWKERQEDTGEHYISLPERISRQSNYSDEWAGSHPQSVADFEKALKSIPKVDSDRLGLAMRWFFSALREYELGRPLVEAGLNWVCLESQANFIGIKGGKQPMVKKLLAAHGISNVPKLANFYKLRNNAFHDGVLTSFIERDAQAARTAGRFLVRAQLLNLTGMPLGDMRKDFSDKYLI